MLLKENFTEHHIRELQTISGRDPALIERAVYAFGLLDAISTVGMPFVFKGGTSLMLLFEHPMRLSADIDIIVNPGVDIDRYIREASKIFPFESVEEQKRKGKNNIEKRHFKFTYASPLAQGRTLYILLDIVMEENHYGTTIEREIKNELLLTNQDDRKVRMPDINGILADKLTAFAPKTTGIPLHSGKNMEIMKQFYDICTLMDKADDFKEVEETYKEIVTAEIGYRGGRITREDCLKDSYQAALCIAGRGRINPEEYREYLEGIRDLGGHIYIERYTPEVAAIRAPKVMYLAVCMLKMQMYEAIDKPDDFVKMKFQDDGLKCLKYLRAPAPMSYAYAIQAERLMNEAQRKSV